MNLQKSTENSIASSFSINFLYTALIILIKALETHWFRGGGFNSHTCFGISEKNSSDIL